MLAIRRWCRHCAQEVGEHVTAMTAAEITTNNDDVQLIHYTACKHRSHSSQRKQSRNDKKLFYYTVRKHNDIEYVHYSTQYTAMTSNSLVEPSLNKQHALRYKLIYRTMTNITEIITHVVRFHLEPPALPDVGFVDRLRVLDHDSLLPTVNGIVQGFDTVLPGSAHMPVRLNCWSMI